MKRAVIFCNGNYSDVQSARRIFRATIAGREKGFSIRPEMRIFETLVKYGFEPVWTKEWRTSAGKPRKDYAFRLTHKKTAFNLGG